MAETEISYEKLRELNIARNNRILESLALPVTPPQPSQGKSPPKRPRTKRELIQLPTRSSPRANKADSILVSLPDDYDEDAVEREPKRKGAARNKARYSVDADDTSSAARSRAGQADTSKAETKAVSAGPSDSSRNLVAQLQLLKTVLGLPVPGGNVKASVMRFVSPSREPKFSKYTGEIVYVSVRAALCLGLS